MSLRLPQDATYQLRHDVTPPLRRCYADYAMLLDDLPDALPVLLMLFALPPRRAAARAIIFAVSPLDEALAMRLYTR